MIPSLCCSVALVGHSRSAITRTVANQLGLLNTNSRFAYACLGELSARVVKTLVGIHPPASIYDRASEEAQLSTCVPGSIPSSDNPGTDEWVVFAVNSGSEATDLALRIARVVVSN